jgi:hypothetical protein
MKYDRMLKPSTAMLAVSMFIITGTRAWSEELSGVAVKIEVTNPSANAAGPAVDVKLLDPANSPAPAKKDLNVEIQTKAENG